MCGESTWRHVGFTASIKDYVEHHILGEPCGLKASYISISNLSDLYCKEWTLMCIHIGSGKQKIMLTEDYLVGQWTSQLYQDLREGDMAICGYCG
jgi:hypothetical protein